jgi:hypothetical protein
MKIPFAVVFTSFGIHLQFKPNLKLKRDTMKFQAISLLSILASASAFAPTCLMSNTRQSTTSVQAERKPFISGNWKLNPQTKDEAVTLASEIAASIGPDTPNADVALFVPMSKLPK